MVSTPLSDSSAHVRRPTSVSPMTRTRAGAAIAYPADWDAVSERGGS
jgi:hypothetical protein